MDASARTIPFSGQHYLEAELEELVKDNKIWRFLRAGSLDGIWFWDLEDPAHEWMSPEFWELFGIDPQTRKHDPVEWQGMIHHDDLKLAIENFEKHCADPSHPYDQVVRYRHADGSTVWVRCRGLAIRDEDGKPIRMLGAHNDVTQLKLAEEKAQREQEEATRANEELQTFAYSTSHDLKSPANTIRMLLQEMRLALDSGDLADVGHLLTKAETTNDSMRRLVDDLLEYTRLIGAEVELGPVDLDTLVSETLASLAGDIEASGATFNVHSLGMATGVAWQLRQLFQNLLSNAIKFQPVGQQPEISIKALSRGNGRVALEVADNGIGIALKDQTHIFDLFSKLHRPTVFQGSGIGLAFCYRVAKAHGSEISIHSAPKRGTTFRFSLPA